MNLIPDIIHEVENYLNFIDRLHWSSVTKNFLVLIDRKKISSYISAIRLTHYLEWTLSENYIDYPIFNHNMVKPINNPPNKKYLAEDIKCFMEHEPSNLALKFLANEMFKLYNINTYSLYFRYNKCYRLKKIIVSQDIWDPNPRTLINQKVCAIYRCRKMGILKKTITDSLVLKALIY